MNKVSGGIYIIENLITGKIYVGKSKNINSRLKQHKRALNKNYHVNAVLQNDWNEYGENNFKFDILKYTDDNKKLLYYESYYADKYICKGLYNVGKLYNHNAIKYIEKDINMYIDKIKQLLPKGDSQYTKIIHLDLSLRNYLILDNYHIKTLICIINNCYNDIFNRYTFNITTENIIIVEYIPQNIIDNASENIFLGI